MLCSLYNCSSVGPKGSDNETIKANSNYFDIMEYGELKSDTINPKISKLKIIYDTSYYKKNDTCRINLISYFNTGYLWTLVQNEDSLQYLGEKSKSVLIDKKYKDLQQFLFIGRDTGAYRMLFTYKRPFEADSLKKVSLYRTIILK